MQVRHSTIQRIGIDQSQHLNLSSGKGDILKLDVAVAEQVVRLCFAIFVKFFHAWSVFRDWYLNVGPVGFCAVD